MRPSDIEIRVPPFCDTLGKTELECAAAYLVRTMAVTGDTWRAVSLPEVMAALLADAAAKHEPIMSLLANPFCRPDFMGLVSQGFATRAGETFALTEQAIARIAKWSRVPKEKTDAE